MDPLILLFPYSIRVSDSGAIFPIHFLAFSKKISDYVMTVPSPVPVTTWILIANIKNVKPSL
jgi:hypothetical protein